LEGLSVDALITLAWILRHKPGGYGLEWSAWDRNQSQAVFSMVTTLSVPVHRRQRITWFAGYIWNMVKDIPANLMCDPVCKNKNTLRRTRPQCITRSTIIIILEGHSDVMKYHERITVYCTLCNRYGLRK
jgi:hypothetical protein